MKKLLLILILIISFLLLVINENININAKILILDNKDEELAYINNGNITSSVDIDEINPKYISYIIEIEDKSFYKHNGLDIKRIFSSIYYKITNNYNSGASTITQQYIKNTYLNNNRTIKRKLKEMALAIRLESTMSKKEILEGYLSSIYFGNNVYGLKYACKYYFNKDINELGDNEMISLIALWNSPSILSNDIDKWNNKKNIIAKKLYKNNLLNNNEYNEVIKPIKLNINTNYISSNRLYYIDQVLNEFKKENINTGFNKEIAISTKYNKSLEEIKSNIEFAFIAYDKNGYIISCAGGKDYNKSSYNIAIGSKRDIGSTIKPLLYYEAIKCGFENQIYNSNPYSFYYNNDLINIYNNSNRYYSNINMYTALGVSDNIYAVRTHLDLGMNTLAYHLRKYNIKAEALPSLALGSVGMSLKKLCDIYSQFFNVGVYMNTIFISKIEYDNRIYEYTPTKQILNDKNICQKVNNLLAAPFDATLPYSTLGSISRSLNTKCKGKSGTTKFDSYVIGFNDDYLVGVWSGNADNNEITNENLALSRTIFVNTINKTKKP